MVFICTCNPEHNEKLHGSRFVVANTHGVDLLQAVAEVGSHLSIVAVQRLDVLHARQAQLALLHVPVSQDHAQEEQVRGCLGNEFDPRRVKQLSHLQRTPAMCVGSPRNIARSPGLGKSQIIRLID